jgi:hypothetical protein
MAKSKLETARLPHLAAVKTDEVVSPPLSIIVITVERDHKLAPYSMSPALDVEQS